MSHVFGLGVGCGCLCEKSIWVADVDRSCFFNRMNVPNTNFPSALLQLTEEEIVNGCQSCIRRNQISPVLFSSEEFSNPKSWIFQGDFAVFTTSVLLDLYGVTGRIFYRNPEGCWIEIPTKQYPSINPEIPFEQHAITYAVGDWLYVDDGCRRINMNSNALEVEEIAELQEFIEEAQEKNGAFSGIFDDIGVYRYNYSNYKNYSIIGKKFSYRNGNNNQTRNLIKYTSDGVTACDFERFDVSLNKMMVKYGTDETSAPNISDVFGPYALSKVTDGYGYMIEPLDGGLNNVNFPPLDTSSLLAETKDLFTGTILNSLTCHEKSFRVQGFTVSASSQWYRGNLPSSLASNHPWRSLPPASEAIANPNITAYMVIGYNTYFRYYIASLVFKDRNVSVDCTDRGTFQAAFPGNSIVVRSNVSTNTDLSTLPTSGTVTGATGGTFFDLHLNGVPLGTDVFPGRIPVIYNCRPGGVMRVLFADSFSLLYYSYNNDGAGGASIGNRNSQYGQGTVPTISIRGDLLNDDYFVTDDYGATWTPEPMILFTSSWDQEQMRKFINWDIWEFGERKGGWYSTGIRSECPLFQTKGNRLQRAASRIGTSGAIVTTTWENVPGVRIGSQGTSSDGVSDKNVNLNYRDFFVTEVGNAYASEKSQLEFFSGPDGNPPVYDGKLTVTGTIGNRFGTEETVELSPITHVAFTVNDYDGSQEDVPAWNTWNNFSEPLEDDCEHFEVSESPINLSALTPEEREYLESDE